MTIHAIETTGSAGVLADLRRVFATGHTRSLEWRLEQLRGIERFVGEREPEIAAALAEDLGRSPVEAWLGDVASTKGGAAYAHKHLKKWMRRRRESLPLAQLPGRAWVQYDPVGVVLVTEIPETRAWDLSYLGVIPEVRRRGLGRELVHKVQIEAQLAGVSNVSLSVDTRNRPAWELYLGMGFEPYDRREVYLMVWR